MENRKHLATFLGTVARRVRLTRAVRRGLGVLFWALVAASVAIIVDRIVFLGLDERYAVAAAAGAGLLGLMVAFVHPELRQIDAAVVADLSLRLRTRVSTAVAMDEASGAMAKAVVEDAVAATRAADIKAGVPWCFGTTQRYVFIPAIVVLLVAVFMPHLDLFGREGEALAAEAERARVAEETAKLKKRLDMTSKRLTKKDAGDLAALSDEITNLEKKLANKTTTQALVEISKLQEKIAKAAAARKKASKAGEALKQGLSKGMKDSLAAKSPAAAKIAEALAKSDFEKAAAGMRELAEEAAAGQMSKDELTKTGEAMKELAAQMKKIPGMGEMANALGQAAPGASGTQLAKALEQAGMTAEDLAKLAGEMKALDDAMKDIAACKSGLLGEGLEGFDPTEAERMLAQGKGTCGSCNGKGCGRCGGTGTFDLGETDKTGSGTGGPGKGRGGAPPEETHDVGYEKTKVTGNMNKGKILGGFFIKGAPPTGEGKAEYAEEYATSVEEAAEALTRHRVPARHEGAVKTYFDSIRPEDVDAH